MGDAYGGDVTPDDLPENIKKITNNILDMKQECDQKLKEGFQSNEEKLD